MTKVSANVNHVMQQLTQVQFNSGEQNKDMSKARQDRDYKDTQTIISCLCDRNPFSLDNNLRNISTGVCSNYGILGNVIGLAAFMRGRELSTLVVILSVCHSVITGKSLSGHQT